MSNEELHMGKHLYTAQQFINAMPGSGGIIATIAKRVGCDWHTAKKYITEYATVKIAYEAECETIDDMAESTIIKSIQDGNTQDAKWWLARKRREKFATLEHKDITTGGEKLIPEPTYIDYRVAFTDSEE